MVNRGVWFSKVLGFVVWTEGRFETRSLWTAPELPQNHFPWSDLMHFRAGKTSDGAHRYFSRRLRRLLGDISLKRLPFWQPRCRTLPAWGCTPLPQVKCSPCMAE